MFEIFIEEILKVRGQRSIAREYGIQFSRKIHYYSRLNESQLTFRYEQITHLRRIAEKLELPLSFIVALLRYTKIEEEYIKWRLPTH